MPLTSKVRVAVNASQVNPLDLGSASVSIAKDYSAALGSGTALGQADRIFHDTRTLAASATEDLDLAGVLVDALGGDLTFVKVKAVIISADPGNVNNVVVGGAAANGFTTWVGGATHTVTVRPGATFALFAGVGDAGYAVTAATGDLLRVGNSGAGTAVTYDVVIIGTSA